MSHDSVDRRSFLKLFGSAAAAGAASAFVPALPTLAAGRDEFPTRLVVFFSGNGTIQDRWRPNGKGRNFTIPDDGILTPLRDWKDDLLIVDGIDMRTTNSDPLSGGAHMKGMGHLLTGSHLRETGKFTANNGNEAGYPDGKSVDQFIAEKVNGNRRFKSLSFGVQSGGANVRNRMCYSGPGEPVHPIQDPFEAFSRLFEENGADRRQMQNLLEQRKSVLDFVQSDLEEVEQQVGHRDRQRLTKHLASVRELERQLMTGDDQGNACEKPNKGGRFDPQKTGNYPKTGQLMMDMIVGAFNCDLTRVASIQWDGAVSNVKPRWVGVNKRHHKMSHQSAQNEEDLVTVNRWYARQFAYLMEKLDSIPEGNGTMLDNTVVMWANELGDGDQHDRQNIPVVIGGGGGGYLDTGRHLNVDRPHNDLLVSLCRSMGVQTDSFGIDKFNNGPIQALTG